MTPTVSIITVTYNAGSFLEETIKSVQQQACTDYEYIIVDGSSKDNTVDIINKYKNTRFHSVAEAQQRTDGGNGIVWISERDNGLYDAMNKGIQMAHGQFIWFINAGDRLYAESTVQDIVSAIHSNNGCDVVYGQSIIIDIEGTVVGERHKIAPPDLSLKSMLDGLVVCHQSILVKTAIAPFYNLKYKLSSDYEWVCHVLSKTNRCVYIDDYISRFLEGGVSSKRKVSSWRERFSIMRKYFGLCKTSWAHFVFVCKAIRKIV